MSVSQVTVDFHQHLGPMRRIWASIGYDELNWTTTTRGKAIHRLLGEDVLNRGPYWVRMHNTFTSGNELSTPAWGAGNPYHELPDGSVKYRWQVLDDVFDAIIQPGGIPLVELGFMPKDLSSVDRQVGLEGYTPAMLEYELGAWRYPPKSLEKWSQLVHDFVRHVVDRYGEEHVKQWRFELWNEPDISHYWQGSVSDYCALFDASFQGAKRAFPEAQVGGPATTHRGPAFLDSFLSHTRATGNHPDFISFHTKGAFFDPKRAYSPFEEVPRQAPSTDTMLGDIERSLEVVAKYPEYQDLPVYVDECDPAVGTIFGVYDNPNFIVANSEYYASFVCQLAGKLLDEPRVTLFTHWAFYFEGKRWFEGNRSLVDNENVEKPILNGLRFLEWLADGQRVSVQSDDPAVGGIASWRDGRGTLLLWNHDDAWWTTGETTVEVTLASSTSIESATLWRLDKDHGNTYREWEALDSPQDVSADEVEQIRKAGMLRPEDLTLEPNGSGISASLSIPVHGLAFIELT